MHRIVRDFLLFPVAGCLFIQPASAAITVATNEKTVTTASRSWLSPTPPPPPEVHQFFSAAATPLADGGYEVRVNDQGNYFIGGGITRSESWREVRFTFTFDLDEPAAFSHRSGVVPDPTPVRPWERSGPGQIRLEGGPLLPVPGPFAGAEASGTLAPGRYTLTGVAGWAPPAAPHLPSYMTTESSVFNDFTFRVAPEPAAIPALLGAAATLMLRRRSYP